MCACVCVSVCVCVCVCVITLRDKSVVKPLCDFREGNTEREIVVGCVGVGVCGGEGEGF